MNDIAISARGLAKQYRLGVAGPRYNTFRDTLADWARRPAQWLRRGSNDASGADSTMWALRDVSFDIPRGEAVGVIGRNGAGKSTLLKILSRVTDPTDGYADIHGRVGSLLEVGTGFHPELTGRENTFLSGAILGMGRKEMERKFDAIVDFSEVSQFIDTPVKHYSSGMYLRLAFAVAAHLEPEILLVDEVLAVGDMAFQRKCLDKMKSVGARGQTVVFVSHDLSVVSRLASRSMILEKGSLVFFGPTDEAIERYAARPAASDSLAERRDRSGDGLLRCESFAFRDGRGRIVDSIPSGGEVNLVVGIASRLPQVQVDDLALDVRFSDALGHPVVTLSTRFGRGATGAFTQRGTLECRIPTLPLAAANYTVDLWLNYRGGTTDVIGQAGELQVLPADYYGTGQEPVPRKHGCQVVPHSWCLTDSLSDIAPLAVPPEPVPAGG
jgi:lipopolysaccharide transport system ATP-binding protein